MGTVALSPFGEWPSVCAVVIPCHNEGDSIASLVRDVRRIFPTVIVVDDGSTDETAEAAQMAGARVIRHESRRGKGAALETAFRSASEQRFSWVLTMDGDGQHDVADVEKFLAAAERSYSPMIVGTRMHDAAVMPFVRRWVNRIMSWCLSRRAGFTLPDSQCGFRLMRLEQWSSLGLDARHFVYESELLVTWCRAGFRVGFVPVRVIYGRSRASHINPWLDTIRWLSWLALDGGTRRALANTRSRA